MPWSEIRPGLYQRPLGENEEFIKLIGDRAHPIGREQWSITSSAAFKLSHPLNENDLVHHCSQAWKALRFEHPSIASQSVDSVLTYEVPNAKALRVWVDETFHTHSPQISKEDLIASLKPSNYVTVHLLLSEPGIVLHLPHWRTDGYGALHLINAFLKHLSSAIHNTDKSIDALPWAEEVQRLVPSIEELLNLSLNATPEVCDSAKKYLSTASLARGAVGLSPSEGVEPDTSPLGTRSTHLRFTTTETKIIQEACRARQIDILAAIHASCAAVTYANASADNQERPYTSTIRLNLRPSMPAPYNGAVFAAGLCTGGYFESIPYSQCWSENVAHYNKAYDLGVTNEFLACRRQYAKEVIKMLRQTPPPQQSAGSEIDISNVGDVGELVEQWHRDESGEVVLEVRDVGVGVETLTRQVYCFFWVWRGRLELELVWNEAFYTGERCGGLVSGIREVLLRELGLLQNGH